ncbi:collagen alpha-1(I) chain-like isoform X11 [Felis catus]|uniref:collagen alpha-1(I) chain-like isoform X11 n=1 Tax=Felis catus TaxID=9685 RepID=UPI001D19A558|nr:collagen alpha-1(I) chain-like isoform X11 [Felis catus]
MILSDNTIPLRGGMKSSTSKKSSAVDMSGLPSAKRRRPSWPPSACGWRDHQKSVPHYGHLADRSDQTVHWTGHARRRSREGLPGPQVPVIGGTAGKGVPCYGNLTDRSTQTVQWTYQARHWWREEGLPGLRVPVVGGTAGRGVACDGHLADWSKKMVRWPRQARGRPREEGLPGPRVPVVCGTAGRSVARNGHLADGSVRTHSLEKLNKMSENSPPSFSSKLRSSTLSAPGKVRWPRQARGRPREEGLPGPRVPVVCGTAGRSVARNGHLADGSVRTHSLEKLNKMSENSPPSFSSKLRSSTLSAPGKVRWPRQARGRPREEGLPGPRVPVVCGTAGRSVARNGHLADGSVRTHSLEKLNKMSENSPPSFSSKLRSSTLSAPGKVRWPRQARGRPREEGLPGPRVPVVCGTAGRSVARNGHLADGSVRTHSLEKLNKMSENSPPSFSSKLRSSTLSAPGKVRWPRQARGRPREEGLPGPRVPVVCGTAGRSVARNGHLADGSVRTHSLEKLNKMSENSPPSFSSKLRSSTLSAPGKVRWPRQARGRPREEGLPGPRVPVVCGTAGRSVARNGHLADGSVRTHSLEKLNKMSENSPPSFSSKLRSSTLSAPGKVRWPRQARGRPREEGLPGPRVPVVCGTAGRSVARNGHLADGSVRTHSLEKLNKMSENSPPSFSSKLRSSTLSAPGKVRWPRQARGRPREEGLPGPRVPVVCGTAGRSVARNGHLADGSVRTHSLEKLNKMSENSPPSFSSKLRSSTLSAPGKVRWPRQARGRPREEGLPGPRVPVVCGTAGRSVARNGHLADGSVRTVRWPRQARGRPREEGLPGPRVPVVCGTAGRSVARNGHLADGSVRTHSLEKLNKMSENSPPSFSSKLRSSTLSAPGKVRWPRQARGRPREEGLPGPRVPVVCGTAGRSVARNGHLADGSVRTHSLEKLNKMSENSPPSFSSKLRSSTLSAPGKVRWPRQARGRPREEGLPGPRVPVVCGTAGRSVARNGHLADGSVRTHSLEKLNKMSENSPPSFSSKLRSSTLSAPGKVRWPRQARGRPREEGLPGPRVPVVCGTAGRSVARNGHLADGSVRTHSLEKLNKMSENSPPSFSSKLRSSTLSAPGKVSVRDSRLPVGHTASSTSTHGLRLGEARGVSPGQGAVSPP